MADYFPLSEYLYSAKAAELGIKNVPTPTHLENWERLKATCLVPIRERVGGPVTISGGYRSKALNDVTPGASSTSAHCLGCAADLQVLPSDAHPYGIDAGDLMAIIYRMGLPVDQVILEMHGAKRWVHVGIKPVGEVVRNQYLLSPRVGEYVAWMPVAEGVKA